MPSKRYKKALEVVDAAKTYPLKDAVGDNTDRVKQPAVTDGGAQADGRGHDVGGSHPSGVPRAVVEQTRVSTALRQGINQHSDSDHRR